MAQQTMLATSWPVRVYCVAYRLDEGLYTGSMSAYRPEGYGTLVYYANNPNGWHMYIGQWLNGKPNGHGTMLHRSGASYVGGWSNGQRQGHGVMTYDPNQSRKLIFVGEYNSNQKKEGVFTTIEAGSVVSYTGKFRNGSFHDDYAWIVYGGKASSRKYRDGIWIDNPSGEPDLVFQTFVNPRA